MSRSKNCADKSTLQREDDAVYFRKTNDVVIYCDGFLKFDGMQNGCSVAVVKNNEVKLVRRFLLKQISNSKLKMFAETYPITNIVVEYFAVYRALQMAKKYNASYIYSDCELIVKQVNDEWSINYPHLKIWNKLCRKFYANSDTMLLWISRKKNVEVLGH